jgi:hypothetical protein
MTKSRSMRATEIPLSLVPHAIARLIRERGEKVYRVSVKRTHYHHYNISVRTRLLPRELRPVPDPVPTILSEEEGVV